MKPLPVDNIGNTPTYMAYQLLKQLTTFGPTSDCLVSPKASPYVWPKWPVDGLHDILLSILNFSSIHISPSGMSVDCCLQIVHEWRTVILRVLATYTEESLRSAGCLKPAAFLLFSLPLKL